MRNYRLILLLIVGLSVISFTALAALRSQSVTTTTSSQQPTIQQTIISHSSGLEVVSMEAIATQANAVEMRYTVRNISNQAITAFTLAVGSGAVTTDFYGGVGEVLTVLEPNATRSVSYFLSPEETQLPVRIAAVFYANGVFEGERQYTVQIRGMRTGLRNQLVRLLPLIQRQLLDLQAQRVSHHQAVENLLTEVSRLPNRSTTNPNENGGLSDTIQFLQFELNRLRNGMSDDDGDAKLRNFAARVETMIARLDSGGGIANVQ